MLSHYELYKIAGILHSGTVPSCLLTYLDIKMLTKFQDISIGNILVSDDTKHLTGALRQKERQGFLIDLNHAKRAKDSAG